MNDEQIKHMVDRFLAWKLPANFSPDAGISFRPEFNVEYMANLGKPPMRHEPTGTNLFDAIQVEAMVRHMVEGTPTATDIAEILTMTGCRDVEDLQDMANVGQSLMSSIEVATSSGGPLRGLDAGRRPGRNRRGPSQRPGGRPRAPQGGCDAVPQLRDPSPRQVQRSRPSREGRAQC